MQDWCWLNVLTSRPPPAKFDYSSHISACLIWPFEVKKIELTCLNEQFFFPFHNKTLKFSKITAENSSFQNGAKILFNFQIQNALLSSKILQQMSFTYMYINKYNACSFIKTLTNQFHFLASLLPLCHFDPNWVYILKFLRTDYWMGIGQVVNLRENTVYAVSAFIKQLNNNTEFWQTYSFTAAYQWTDDGKINFDYKWDMCFDMYSI